MSGPPKQMHESIFEPPAPPPASPQPPALQQSLSLVNNDDAIEEVLKQGDLRMLRGPRDRAPEESGSTTQEQSWSRRRATVE